MRTYEEGGFSVEYNDVDEFINARKEQPRVEAEWISAREVMKEDMADGPLRVSDSHRVKLSNERQQS